MTRETPEVRFVKRKQRKKRGERGNRDKTREKREIKREKERKWEKMRETVTIRAPVRANKFTKTKGMIFTSIFSIHASWVSEVDLGKGKKPLSWVVFLSLSPFSFNTANQIYQLKLISVWYLTSLNILIYWKVSYNYKTFLHVTDKVCILETSLSLMLNYMHFTP